MIYAHATSALEVLLGATYQEYFHATWARFNFKSTYM